MRAISSIIAAALIFLGAIWLVAWLFHLVPISLSSPRWFDVPWLVTNLLIVVSGLGGAVYVFVNGQGRP